MRAIDIHLGARVERVAPGMVSMGDLGAMSAESLAGHVARVEAWLAGLVITTAEHARMAAAMDRRVERDRHKRRGASSVIAISGPNGVGKSTFLRAWVERFYRRELSASELDEQGLPTWQPEPGMTATRIPVVWLSPGGATAKTAFSAQIARFLGYQGSRAPADALGLLERHGVRLLVVDDCHFLRLTKSQVGQAMLNTLKTANNELGELGGKLVLAGANLHSGDLFADQQIARRLELHTLAAHQITTLEEKQSWQRLLKLFEAASLPYLPAGEPGFLARPAPAIWRRTQGYLRDVHELVIDVVVEAIRSRRGAVAPAMFADAGVSAVAQVEEHALSRKSAGRTSRARGA